MNVLELFSGVGGMHMALKESGIDANVVAAADINTVANSVYTHNFPDTVLLNRNIQSLTSKYINKLGVDVILMSPPCQPFTRNGLKGDHLDPRTCSFTHLLNILSELNIKCMLIENVKGFETSKMHDYLIKKLAENNFDYQEYILSPNQIGIPNTRHRYYCLAKKKEGNSNFKNGIIMETLPEIFLKCETPKISEIIEDVDVSDYLLPDDILLKRSMIIDICTPESNRSCCFTKAYGRYVEGTGSVFTPKSKDFVDEIYKQVQLLPVEQRLQQLKRLELRFFTPREVARLMSFSVTFSFPNNVTNIQRYRLLGNSVNVRLVSVLIKILLET